MRRCEGFRRFRAGQAGATEARRRRRLRDSEVCVNDLDKYGEGTGGITARPGQAIQQPQEGTIRLPPFQVLVSSLLRRGCRSRDRQDTHTEKYRGRQPLFRTLHPNGRHQMPHRLSPTPSRR